MKAEIHVEPTLRHEDDSIVGMVSVSALASSFREDERKALNLICVIDTSFSMKDGKLDLVKATLDFVIEHLTPKDRVALVHFGSRAEIVFDLMEMTSENKEITKRKIYDVRYGGSTNISGGLLMGLDVVIQDNERGEKLDVSPLYNLMLFTDGAANRGITDIPSLTKAVESVIEPIKTNTNIFAFGFGKDHDEEMLTEISGITHGDSYYYIEDQEDIGPQFAECLGGLLSLVAQNVTLEIKCGLDSGYIIPKVWSSKQKRGDNSILIDIGDIYYEQQRDIVFVFKSLYLEFVLECNLSYFNVITNEAVRNQNAECTYSELSKPEDSSINPEVLRNYQRVTAAECIKRAMVIAQTDLESAKVFINQFITRLMELNGGDEEDVLVNDLKKCLDVMESRERYLDIGKATLSTVSISHENQRSSHYATSYQNQMVGQLLTSEAYLNASSTPQVHDPYEVCCVSSNRSTLSRSIYRSASSSIPILPGS